MPWPTTDGMRNLQGAEADLVRGAIGMMVDTHVGQLRESSAPWRYGVPWFDQWDVGQRLWLLDKVTVTLFGRETIDSPAAMFDATVDAVFHEILDLVLMEIDQPEPTRRSWRQSVLEATNVFGGVGTPIPHDETDPAVWQRQVTAIADRILGVRLYRRAEAFRDGDYERVVVFLRDRGLPADYLSRIPPLLATNEIQQAIDRIQSYVFR
ncbi:hypothetical protein FYK55_15455 [Roseiconus nitratireducens]|uniref:Uncharacterized protein n=1 Tax=Roseiconus nitratireducens TaxID=2605748 RepID=A0A5M6D6M3_9BACT|nr:hypothetical protein [Roseiconus nitratireducens]KAA5542200.1 hypothetical protein FYK55_15455 [Roseiconus nitratireducens]